MFTPYELGVYIQSLRTDLVIEQWEQPRNPLPVSSLRVLTINTSSQTELLCAVFLPAPEGSVSTAYFDLDIYLINHCNNCIGEPLNPASSRDYCGLAIPEVSTVIDTCISLHNRLPQHLEISWDVILTADAPVFLEGNVFPPGCDYKLSIFKNDDNIRFLKKKIIGSA